jgi:hypothetical protein
VDFRLTWNIFGLSDGALSVREEKGDCEVGDGLVIYVSMTSLGGPR